MEKIIKGLIKNLSNLYNYNIIEFDYGIDLIGNFGVFKNNSDSSVVIFFSEFNSRDKLDKAVFKNLLERKLDCNNLNLIEVSLVSKLDLEHYRKINSQCGLILIDVVQKNIMCSDPSLNEIANQLGTCMNNMIRINNRNPSKKIPIITYIIIVLNIIAYIFTAYLSKNIADSNINVLVLLGAKVNSLISQGQYYRLITCMFLHGGIIHIALNMYALVAIGTLVEDIYGKTKYTIIYFISGLISSIFSFEFSQSISIGASGAIFGLLGASLVFGIKMKDRIHKDYIINVLSVVVVNLIIGFSMPNVDNFGHIGGLIGGIIISYVLFPRL